MYNVFTIKMHMAKLTSCCACCSCYDNCKKADSIHSHTIVRRCKGSNADSNTGTSSWQTDCNWALFAGCSAESTHAGSQGIALKCAMQKAGHCIEFYVQQICSCCWLFSDNSNLFDSSQCHSKHDRAFVVAIAVRGLRLYQQMDFLPQHGIHL